MRLSPRQELEPEINLTSLIDVVFLLLIFFMVSTTFEHATALHIDLPEASASNTDEPQPQPQQLELAIDPEGRMYLNDQQLIDSRPQTIRAAMSAAAGSERSLPVIIRADAQTPHHFVVTAMDITGQLGFSRLSIATERVTETD